jgi:hypothetical protein
MESEIKNRLKGYVCFGGVDCIMESHRDLGLQLDSIRRPFWLPPNLMQEFYFWTPVRLELELTVSVITMTLSESISFDCYSESLSDPTPQ